MQEAISLPDHLPPDLRRHLAGRGRLPDRQHVLDPRRPAQPRARPAPRPRRLAAAGDPVGAARGVRPRPARVDDRARASACCWPSASAASSRQFGLDLSGQPLIMAPTHHPCGVRRRRRRHHGRGLLPGPPDRPDRAGPGAARRRRDAGVVAPPPVADRGRADGRRWRGPDGAGSSSTVPRAGLLGRRRHPGDPARRRLGEPGHRPAIPRGRGLASTRRLFGSVGKLAGQNSLRNPRRTTATASALMIGLSLACTMAIVGASAKASVDQMIEENFVGDYVVSNLVGQGFSSTDRRAHGARCDGRRERWCASASPSRLGRRRPGRRRRRPRLTMRRGSNSTSSRARSPTWPTGPSLSTRR